MKIREEVNPKDFECGVIIARFQTNKLHQGHIDMINHVTSNHKKVVILLGIPVIQNTKRNPLDFATRQYMITQMFPNVIVLPIKDMRDNAKWSTQVDTMISAPFGEKKAVIYGSRDSFIPYYSGKHSVLELEATDDYNATNIREEVAKETLATADFRAGVIYQAFNSRPVLYSTVDVTAYNDKGEILMAKKPNEKYWRFVGGFVDTTDKSKEEAAFREFSEETGGNCELHKDLQYIASQYVEDWRYAKEESGIMTTLFLGRYKFGMAKASDDIAEVEWVPIRNFSNYDGIRTRVMPEHRELMQKLVDKVYTNRLIPNIGDRIPERGDNVTYIGE